jgi:hypothetical protein
MHPDVAKKVSAGKKKTASAKNKTKHAVKNTGQAK